MVESQVERRLKNRIEKSIPGAMCLKFVSPGQSGVPDRVILLPHGFSLWVELKRPGETPRPLQRAVIARFRRIGHIVLVVDSYDKVDMLTVWCQDWLTAWENDEPIPAIPDSLMEVCSGVE